MLATSLGTACAEAIHEGTIGVMMAVRGDRVEAVPLEDVAGYKNLIPADPPWAQSARHVGTMYGDE